MAIKDLKDCRQVSRILNRMTESEFEDIGSTRKFAKKNIHKIIEEKRRIIDEYDIDWEQAVNAAIVKVCEESDYGGIDNYYKHIERRQDLAK